MAPRRTAMNPPLSWWGVTDGVVSTPTPGRHRAEPGPAFDSGLPLTTLDVRGFGLARHSSR
jgi:hypothetical protein